MSSTSSRPARSSGRPGLAGVAFAALGLALSIRAADDVVVTAGPQYRAGAVHRFFFGDHYRDLWTTPLAVPVLDLSSFAGGLTPLARGGGFQTKSLRFRGADGRQYAFRSVDKDPSAVLPPKLRETVADRIVEDQMSLQHPAGALVVAPFLEAAGVLHTEPKLFVMPDDPALGAFRQEFAGMLGTLEERPDDEGAPFAGASKVIGTEKLLERLREDPREHVDALAYLKARLVDVFLGDWDRHEDQWRWARLEEGKSSPWLPVPRDRDQAFCRLDGLLPSLAHFFAPQLVGFDEDYPGALGLHWNARNLDRRLLSGLERAVWEETAVDLQRRFTDAVIERAVAHLPPEYARLNAADLTAQLRARRDGLPRAATRFYELMAREVDVTLTDDAEKVTIAREGTAVEVTAFPLAGKAAKSGEPSFRRRFVSSETTELRLHLEGGDDVVEIGPGVRGTIALRVLGGKGDDVLNDAEGAARLYDDSGNDRAVGPGAKPPDRSTYAPPSGPMAAAAAPRDWGSLVLPLPVFGVAPDVGLLIGGGPIHYRYGFRQDPYAWRLSLSAALAVEPLRARVVAMADFRKPGSRTHATLLARGSGIEVLRFFGYGNETRDDRDDEFYKVEQRQYEVAPALAFDGPRGGVVTVGPVLKYASTELQEGHLVTELAPYGTPKFGQLGLRAGYRLDTRDVPAFARRGVNVGFQGSVYPSIWDAEETFGEVTADASFTFGFSGRLEPTLALRVAGKKVWGQFPFHESAFVGGRDTVRGFSEQRFAGDAGAWGNAELRIFLTDFFLVLPGEMGVFGLADAGRVWFPGESSDTWHTSAGGGIWFAYLERANTVTVGTAASRETTGFYIRLGFLF